MLSICLGVDNGHICLDVLFYFRKKKKFRLCTCKIIFSVYKTELSPTHYLFFTSDLHNESGWKEELLNHANLRCLNSSTLSFYRSCMVTVIYNMANG